MMIQVISCFKTSKGDVYENKNKAIEREIQIQNTRLRDEMYLRMLALIDEHRRSYLKKDITEYFVASLISLLELDEEAFLKIVKDFTTKTKEVKRLLESSNKDRT